MLKVSQILIFGFLWCIVSSQKTYWFSIVNMTVNLTNNGKAIFNQIREYQFRGGSFTTAFLALFDINNDISVEYIKDLNTSSQIN